MYFLLSDEELLLEAQMEDPWIDPRLFNEVLRRGLGYRLNQLLKASTLEVRHGRV